MPLAYSREVMLGHAARPLRLIVGSSVFVVRGLWRPVSFTKAGAQSSTVRFQVDSVRGEANDPGSSDTVWPLAVVAEQVALEVK